MGPDKYTQGSIFGLDGKTLIVGSDDIFEYVNDFTIDQFKSNFKLPMSNNYFYKQIFHNLCDENEDRKAEYETLLKLNDEDYRRTVLQIECDKGLMETTEV